MNRREVLRGTAYAAALFGIGTREAARGATPLPDAGLAATEPEAYWNRIREEQFLLPNWRSFLNNGSLGIAPKPVVNAVADYVNRSAALQVDDHPRWGYETLDEYRAEFGKYLGCTKDELAFTHNATEAMSTVAAGLDLKAGDEVLLTDQEHPSGRNPWLVRQARSGIVVREVKIPLPPKSPEQLVDVVVSAFGPKTRVVSFSGITTTTGLLMPVREICDAARAKGILSVVDGAHMIGQVPVNLREMGCDLFVGSPHKWLFTPAGCGCLYFRGDMVDRVWPTVVTAGWDNKELKAARFMMVGTNNRAVFEGMMAGLRFHKEIGPRRIYTRIHQLAGTVRERAAQTDLVELLTPDDDRMYGSMVTFRLKKEPAPFFELAKKRRIWIYPSRQMRISSHIHTRPADIQGIFETLRESLA